MRNWVLWACIGLGLGCFQEAAGNRLWWGEFELRGPLQALEVDGGEDGCLHLELDLRAGEVRNLRLPLPLYAPLGAEGLAQIPLQLKIEGAGQARLVRWSDPQPTGGLAALGSAPQSRSKPPAGAPKLRPSPGAMALFLGCSVLLWAARRSVLGMLGIGLLGALILGWSVRGGQAPSRGWEVLELDLESGGAWLARSGWGRLELREGRLEPESERDAITFQMRLEAGLLVGEALSEGSTLVLQHAAAFVDYGAGTNPSVDLERVWVRTPEGAWSFRGAWPGGQDLGAKLALEASPPSWLLAGLPAARGVLIARREGSQERWIRAIGFNPR